MAGRRGRRFRRPGRNTAVPADALPVQLTLPTDADLDTPGPQRSLAYDRAWWFARFVADTYGTPKLRALYLRRLRSRRMPTPPPPSATSWAWTCGERARALAALDGPASLTQREPGPAGNQRLSAATRRHPVLPGGTRRSAGRGTGSHA